MTRTIRNILLIALFLIPAQAFAQNADDGPRGRRGRGGPPIDRIFDRIADDLELDEFQREQLEDIKAAQRERMETFRQHRQTIREARAAGNDALADELRAEWRAERRASGRGPGGWMRDAIGNIESILTEDQITRFAELRNTYRQERRQRFERRSDERFDRLADDLELDASQIEQLDAIRAQQRERMEQFRENWRAVREAYDAGNDELGDQLRDAMRAQAQPGGGPRGMMRETLDAIEPFLDDGQKERLAEIRAEREQRRERRRRFDGDGPNRGRVRGPGPGMMDAGQPDPAELADTLQLDAQQRTTFDTIAAQHVEQTATLDAQIRETQEKLDAARAAGDTAAIDALGQEMSHLQRRRGAINAAFLEQIDGILRLDQRPMMQAYRDGLQMHQDLADAPRDLRRVLRAAMRLRLHRSQKKQLRTIYTDARDTWGEARATDRRNRDRDRTAEQALATQVKSRIEAILDPQQLEQFNERLARQGRGARGRGR